MRTIDADALKELFPDNGEGSWTYNATAKAYIDAQPTVQPETNCSEIPNNSDTISRQQAIEAIEKNACNTQRIMDAINNLPSAQPEQTEMIKEIRKWINSGNRGNADYFIVDRIEEIINAYEIN